MSSPRLRILLVDDHEVVRDGVKSLINANDDLAVVAEAGSVQEAIDQAIRTKPDVVVMDVRLADGSGIEATREIRAKLEKTQVLMLTSFADDEALFASIMAGAAGYVLKQIRGGELIRAIRSSIPRSRARCSSDSARARRCAMRSSRGFPRRRSASSCSLPRARPTGRSAGN